MRLLCDNNDDITLGLGAGAYRHLRFIYCDDNPVVRRCSVIYGIDDTEQEQDAVVEDEQVHTTEDSTTAMVDDEATSKADEIEFIEVIYV